MIGGLNIKDVDIKTLQNDDTTVNHVKKFLFNIIKNDFGYGYVPEYHKDILDMKKFYMDPEKNTFFVAVDKKMGKIIGTAGIRAYDLDFKSLSGRYNFETTASFCRVFVDKNWRRNGIATALVQSAEDFCTRNGYSKVYLHTQKTVDGSLDFWLSRGYKVVLDTENKIGTVHMEKEISNMVNALPAFESAETEKV